MKFHHLLECKQQHPPPGHVLAGFKENLCVLFSQQQSQQPPADGELGVSQRVFNKYC